MTKAAKPVVHARDHEHGGADVTHIHYEDVGDPGGGGGGGIQFDTSPQEGGYLEVTTNDGGILLEVTSPGDDLNLADTDGNVNLTADGINIVSNGNGGVILETDGTGDLLLQLGTGTNLRITGLPTSSPGGSGRVWNNSGVLSIT